MSEQALLIRAIFVALYRDFFVNIPLQAKMSATELAEEEKEGIRPPISVSAHSAEEIPDHANDFVLVYCERLVEHAAMPARPDLIKMTEDMCSWLFEQGLTASRLMRMTQTN